MNIKTLPLHFSRAHAAWSNNCLRINMYLEQLSRVLELEEEAYEKETEVFNFDAKKSKKAEGIYIVVRPHFRGIYAHCPNEPFPLMQECQVLPVEMLKDPSVRAPYVSLSTEVISHNRNSHRLSAVQADILEEYKKTGTYDDKRVVVYPVYKNSFKKVSSVRVRIDLIGNEYEFNRS